MKRTIKIKTKHILITLSFIIPMIIRWIPEAQFPYPIGFDTPLYLAFGKYYASHPSPFLLFNEILGLLYTAKLDLLQVMKYLPTITYGILGTSIYTFTTKNLKWTPPKALATTINTALSVALLRISWDMHKLTLGIALILLALSYINELNTIKNKITFTTLGILTIISHELIMVIFLTILFVYTITAHKNTKKLTTALLITGLIIFLGIWYRNNLNYVFQWIPQIIQTPPFSNIIPELQNNGGLILKLYIFSLPLAIIGYFKNKPLTTWLTLTTIGSLSTVITPTFMLGGVSPWRYILLLTIPISFYTTNGIIKITEKLSTKNTTTLITTLLILIINIQTFSFLGITNSVNYYQTEGIIPNNMIQTSIPIYDIKPTITLLKTVPDNSTLLVYGDFTGWALYYTNAKIIGFGGTYHIAPTLQQALEKIPNKDNLYLLWWDDTTAQQLGFKIISHNGNLKLYKYYQNET